MAHFAVIDTNVLVSALLSKHNDSATVQVIVRMFAGELIPIYDEGIMAEYQEVLRRKKFHFPEEQIQLLLQSITQNGIHSSRMDTGKILPDAKDLVFYEVAMSKQAEGA